MSGPKISRTGWELIGIMALNFLVLGALIVLAIEVIP